MITGKCNYYLEREKNHISRYGKDNLKCPVPYYYRKYGYKYCIKFKKETIRNLSPQGKIWLIQTLNRLQEYMELGLTNGIYYNKLKRKYIIVNECNPNDFKKFAFATHLNGYNPENMSNLTIMDLLYIATTPELKEWSKSSTWIQAWNVAKHINYQQLILK